MAIYLTTDPRTGAGYAATVGRSVRYIDAGTLLVLFKYDTADTDWCTAEAGYTTPVTTDPRSAGLASYTGASVLYVSANVGTRLVKYGLADTDWAEQLPIGGSGSTGVTPRRVVGVTFDGQGSTPTVGSVGYAVVPFSGTIDQWHVVANASGSAVVDVWKAASTIPINADSIAGTEKPTLSAAQIASDTALSSWTTAVTAGDVFGFELESVATCTRLTVEVRISESA
mgnify:CR=1 FL=1